MTHEAFQHPDAIARKHLAAVSQIGEPAMFGVDHADVDGLFRRCGLTTLATLTSTELEERDLVGSDGRTWGRLPTFIGVAEGRVLSGRAGALFELNELAQQVRPADFCRVSEEPYRGPTATLLAA